LTIFLFLNIIRGETQKTKGDLSDNTIVKTNLDSYKIFSQIMRIKLSPTEQITQIPSNYLKQLKILEETKKKLAKRKTLNIESMLNKIPKDFEHILNRKSTLLLRSLYYKKHWADYIIMFEQTHFKNDSTTILFVNSLVKNGEYPKASKKFKDFFLKKGIRDLRKMISHKNLNRFFKDFTVKDWIKKLFFLVDTNQLSEFKRIRPYVQIPELEKIILAFFRYKQNSYNKVRENLKGVRSNQFLPFKFALTSKMKLKKNLEADIDQDVLQVSENIFAFKRYLLNLGKIYFLNNKIQKSILYCNKLLKLYREKLLLKDGQYWDLLWMNICNYFRNKTYQKTPEFLTLLKEGCKADKISINTACRYWYNKLSNRDTYPLSTHPYNYYSLISNQNKRELYFKGVRKFLATIQGIENVEKLNRIIKETSILLKNDLIREAINLLKSEIRYSSSLNAGEKRLLQLIVSIVYLKKQNYQRAFIEFIRNIDNLQAVLPPSFLRDIYFPLKFKQEIDYYSSLYNLNPGIVYSLIREESFFNKEAYSYAKAGGLMQLLVGTANKMRNENTLKLRKKDLFKPLLNIKLGTKYLRFLLDKYDDKMYLALAAYNAGPHRVNKWLQFYPKHNREEFIESIPFAATRGYVKKILRNFFLYKLYYQFKNEGFE
jgi:soluble lytic murein transglycosylase-like protein